jgi:hypothetical protein
LQSANSKSQRANEAYASPSPQVKGGSFSIEKEEFSKINNFL